MKYEFYYADLKLSVVLEYEAEDVFPELTDNEFLSLQQIIYLGLNSFLITRALYGMQNAIPKKYSECATRNCHCPCHQE